MDLLNVCSSYSGAFLFPKSDSSDLGAVMHHFGLRLTQLMADQSLQLPIRNSADILHVFRRLFQYEPVRTIVCNQRANADPENITKHISCKNVNDSSCN